MTWLIDTRKQCLVPATANLPYVALSYVWGQTAMLKTERANLSNHQEDGAFNRLRAMIPTTIRDAIDLVPLIGERYLWVDSLCIVQDEEDSKHTQLRDMARIYENAVLTIVAADGMDADYGLRGIRNVSQPRQMQPELKLASNVTVRAPQNLPLEHTTWARRGWTSQELHFSHRRLTFIDGSVRWVCASGLHFEDEEVASRNGRYNHRPFNTLLLGLDNVCRARLVVSKLPNLYQLQRDIEAYNQRLFTYDEDVLPGFEGTLSIYSQSQFPRGFIHGMPISFLDPALLWHTSTSAPFVELRQSTDPSWECAPRWAWAGWKGAVFWDWEDIIYYTSFYSRHCGKQIIPILTWKLRTSPNSTPVTIPFQNE
ncbi:heterokaryon incompatibility protein-domain-containing protein, partial [Apiosordaria backusii]